jgi:hypothetical protein
MVFRRSIRGALVRRPRTARYFFPMKDLFTSVGLSHPTLTRDGVDILALKDALQDELANQALVLAGGKRSAAAELLGLNRTTFVEYLNRRARRLALAVQEPADDPAHVVDPGIPGLE